MIEPESCGRPPRRPELFGLVRRFWYTADPSITGFEVKLPTTTAQLLINLDDDRLSSGSMTDRLAIGSAGLASIQSGAVVLDRSEQRRIAGVVLRPEAVGAVAGMPAHRVGELADLNALWGAWAERLREAAVTAIGGAQTLDRVEEELVRIVRRAACGPGDPAIRQALFELRRNTRIGEITDLIGLSQSTWTRRFRAAVGVSPKRYQRLLRLELAIGLARRADRPDWAGIAIETGYYDQPHLAGEFAELTGFSPTRWHAAAVGDPYHLPVTPVDRIHQDTARTVAHTR